MYFPSVPFWMQESYFRMIIHTLVSGMQFYKEGKLTERRLNNVTQISILNVAWSPAMRDTVGNNWKKQEKLQE